MIPGIVAGVPSAGGSEPFPLPSLPSPSNVRYWFEASNDVYADAGASDPCTDGEGIYTWLNQGLASDHAVQATSGNRPTWHASGVEARPYVQGDQSLAQFFNDLAEGSQPSGLTSSAAQTVFFVASFPDIASYGGGTLFGTTNTGDSDGVEKTTVDIINSSGGAVRHFKPQVVIGLGDTGADALNVFAVRKDSNGGTFSYARNADNMSSFNQNTNADSSAVSGMSFFRRRSNGAFYFNGKLYEVIYYDARLSNTDCNTVMNYLRDKYGLATV